MPTQPILPGVWCPSVTPFNADNSVDYDALGKHFQRLTEAKINAILLMGSIGEFVSLSLDERLALIRAARPLSPLPMVANVSAGCIDDMVRMADLAYESGYQAVMALPPYYFAQTAHQLECYYRELGRRFAGPWFAYNFPARTGCDLDAALVACLAADMPNFAGIKDTITTPSHTRAITQAVKPIRPDFCVLAGYDDCLISNILDGGDGVISGLNNIVPELFVNACHKWQSGDLLELKRIQRKIGQLSSIYTIGDDFVTTIKTVVARKFGYMSPLSRNFGGELSAQQCAVIDATFDI